MPTDSGYQPSPSDFDPNLLPEKDASDLGPRCMAIISEIIEEKAKQRIPERINRNYELQRNLHFKNTDVSMPLASANLIGKHHTQTCNTLTDNNPTFDAVQRGHIEGDAKEQLLSLTRLCDAWWRMQEQQFVLQSSVDIGERDGTVAEKCSFDFKIGIKGDVRTDSIDMLNFGMYPSTAHTVDQAEACVHYWVSSVRQARKDYPEFADKIMSTSELIKRVGDNREEIAKKRAKGVEKYTTTISNVVQKLGNALGLGAGDEGDDILMADLWVKDDRPEYIGGIRRVKLAGATPVSDDSNPSINPDFFATEPEKAVECYLFSRFPFSLTPSAVDTTSMYGFGDFEQLEGLQMEIDKTLTVLTIFKDKSARTKLINPATSGIENEEFDNMPGILSPANAAESAAIRWLEAPQADPMLQQLLNVYKELFFTVAGTFDLEAGNQPGANNIAVEAIALLIENTTRMLRNKVRNYGRMIRERGRMFISLAQNYYTEERWVNFDRDGEAEGFQITGEQLRIPADIMVISGSTMPKSHVQKAAQAAIDRARGDIDLLTYLTLAGYDMPREIMRRLEEGQLAGFYERLSVLGYPQEMLDSFKTIQQAGDKDLEKAVKEQQVPTFSDFVQQAVQEQQEQGPSPAEQMQQAELQKAQGEAAKSQADAQKSAADAQKLQAEAQKVQSEIEKTQAQIAEIQSNIAVAQAEAEKTAAEAELSRERATSEVKQREVKDFGMDADKEILKIKKAEHVLKQKEFAKEGKLKGGGKTDTGFSSSLKTGGGPYSEKGIVSNNETESE